MVTGIYNLVKKFYKDSIAQVDVASSWSSRMHARAQALGHKNINNTQIHTHLIDFKSDEYDVHAADTVEEAKKLGEAGFDHYDTIGDIHLYRKRK